MQKRMTITMDEVVYEGLVRVVGRRKISAFLEGLARPSFRPWMVPVISNTGSLCNSNFYVRICRIFNL